MSMPFYVSPEQVMKDRADFARQGIARGRSVLVMRYADGIVLVGENHSPSLHKISEIYDRIAFAAVGRYNEFESLRIAGIGYADLRGYAYDRRDVSARGLANAYATQLGTIFSTGVEKPYEVELIVAEVGETPEHDQLYRVGYDGSVLDEDGFAALGGQAERLSANVRPALTPDMSLRDVLRVAVAALSTENGHPLDGHSLEVAVLDRTRPQPRKFRRISAAECDGLLHD
jgi:proteasome alpha subunit